MMDDEIRKFIQHNLQNELNKRRAQFKYTVDRKTGYTVPVTNSQRGQLDEEAKPLPR